MEGFELLTEMNTVEAPLGFEQRVMAELASRKRRRVRAGRLRLVFAGAGVSLAALVLVLGTGVFSPEPARRVSIKADTTAPLALPGSRLLRGPTIPITEAVSYSQEVRKRYRDSRTIYILEHVSNRTDTEIMF